MYLGLILTALQSPIIILRIKQVHLTQAQHSTLRGETDQGLENGTIIQKIIYLSIIMYEVIILYIEFLRMKCFFSREKTEWGEHLIFH